MKRSLLGDALVAGALAFGSFALQGRLGLNLADEGFLWCGARDTARGRRPIRDLDSYDPARYWWSAAFARVCHNDGIVTMRFAAAAWEAIGLLVSLRLARSAGVAPIEAGAELFVLQPWLFPLFRSFDNTMPIFSMFTLTRVLERPELWRSFTAGLAVGGIAQVGRNHGVYAATALGAVLFSPPLRSKRIRHLAAAACGCGAGYAPLFFCLVTDARFRAAFVEGLSGLLRRKSTNITRPIPWPWSVWRHTHDVVDRTESALFAALPIAYAFTAGTMFVAARRGRPVNPSRAAALAVGIPYLHYAFSRADIYHLASSIFPFYWLSMRASRGTRLAFAAVTAVMSTRMTPLILRVLTRDQWVACRVASDLLQLPPADARFVESVASSLDAAGASSEDVFFAPFFPGLYPTLGKRIATYEIYLTLPATEARQRRLIQELDDAGVRFAVVQDIALDNNERHRFQNTHRLLWRHLLRHFDRLPDARLPADVLLLRRARPVDTPPPTGIRFGEPHADGVAVSGYYRSFDASHVWTAPYLMLRLSIPPKATSLAVSGYWPPEAGKLGEQRLRCLVNGEAIGDGVQIPPGSFDLDIALPTGIGRGTAATVELSFSTSFVPRSVGLGPDDRTLGVLLSEVALR